MYYLFNSISWNFPGNCLRKRYLTTSKGVSKGKRVLLCQYSCCRETSRAFKRYTSASYTLTKYRGILNANVSQTQNVKYILHETYNLIFHKFTQNFCLVLNGLINGVWYRAVSYLIWITNSYICHFTCIKGCTIAVHTTKGWPHIV